MTAVTGSAVSRHVGEVVQWPRMDPISLCHADARHHEVTLERPDEAPDLKVDLQFAHDLRAADMDAHRRAQGNRTQYSPQQTPTKPNGPPASSGPAARSR